MHFKIRSKKVVTRPTMNFKIKSSFCLHDVCMLGLIRFCTFVFCTQKYIIKYLSNNLIYIIKSSLNGFKMKNVRIKYLYSIHVMCIVYNMKNTIGNSKAAVLIKFEFIFVTNTVVIGSVYLNSNQFSAKKKLLFYFNGVFVGFYVSNFLLCRLSCIKIFLLF